MKRRISIILTLGILFSTTAFAQNENTIKYKKAEEGYDYGAVYIIRDKATNEIIPLAIGPLDGYSYAYLPKDSDFEVKKETIELKYTDLDDWQSIYISEMVCREIFTGYEDATFRPDKELTRAEMATVFARMFNIPKTRSVSCFDDISENYWAKEYIMALVEKNVFMKDTNFEPDSSITREQLVAMAFRMLERMGMIATQEEQTDLSQYKDLDEVSDYAKTAYKSLIGEGYYLMVEVIDNDVMDKYSLQQQKIL